MRPTTVLSFLAASMTVLSPVYAAPVPTEVDSAGVKRCTYMECRTAGLPSTTSDTPETPLLSLVDVLITALTKFKVENSPTNTTSTDDLSSPAIAAVTELDIIEPEPSA